MKSLAVEHILKYTWKFDPYKKSKITGQYISAFTYLSTITFNAFVATINKRKKEIERQKQEYYESTNDVDHYSTINNDITHSEIEKTISLPNIQSGTLFDIVKSIDYNVDDLLIKIPEDYFISPKELKDIYDFTEKKGVCLSIKRLPLKMKKK
jgi:hypothetical protein